MTVCFVIQPFDNARYDKRYRDCVQPAIVAAGFVPYRVDQDIAVQVPADAIQEAIRSADACLADITTDNPNVWLEIGLAIANGKPLVLICSEERRRLPFDVRHRNVVFYKTDSICDFEALRLGIEVRLASLLRREGTNGHVADERLSPSPAHR